ncbi:cytidine deaminase [Ktedonobacter racemifer]|uniref:Cytidine deaminase n=1 Tax=Ktedonobacter racemifer DSM 44963 TaxID=485913 RepID=D6TP69_KTERA|nr:cytidine deaminase [Ktedonobacter racemifer]EFH87425.1 cytidine deaminase [Ktedonobacter racemifer DSM 44963]
MVSPEQLVARAREAARNAHVPYSHFHVGAAVVADGRVYTGVNIESASYGLTLCAERSALASAISAGDKQVSEIAVACVDAPDGAPLNMRTPCGACRQWMIDLAPDAVIHIDGGTDEQGKPVIHSMHVRDLLPNAFQL